MSDQKENLLYIEKLKKALESKRVILQEGCTEQALDKKMSILDRSIKAKDIPTCIKSKRRNGTLDKFVKDLMDKVNEKQASTDELSVYYCLDIDHLDEDTGDGYGTGNHSILDMANVLENLNTYSCWNLKYQKDAIKFIEAKIVSFLKFLQFKYVTDTSMDVKMTTGSLNHTVCKVCESKTDKFNTLISEMNSTMENDFESSNETDEYIIKEVIKNRNYLNYDLLNYIFNEKKYKISEYTHANDASKIYMYVLKSLATILSKKEIENLSPIEKEHILYKLQHDFTCNYYHKEDNIKNLAESLTNKTKLSS